MYSKLIIAGNLGRDPEMRYLPSGKAVTDMNVATNRVYNDKNGERVTETCWFRVAVWGSMAEAVNQYLRKGSKVLVEGYLKPDPETGNPRIWFRQDGSAAASFEMTAQNVTFLSSKKEDQSNRQNAGQYSDEDLSDKQYNVDDADDIPF